jgi:prepilin peptidase CpaA
MSDHPLPPALAFLLVALVVPAALYDIRSRRIPNWLTLAGIVAGIAVNAILTPGGWGPSLLGAALGFGAYFPFYLVRGMGAGDVKLMAAVGAVSGPTFWLHIFVATGVLGGIFAIVFVIGRKQFQRTLANLMFMLGELASFRPPYARDEQLDVKNPDMLRMPHGAIIALGCLVFLSGATLRLLNR